MIDDPIIVGCGTVGASLAIRLAKEKVVSKLELYDYDVVSNSKEDQYYPFVNTESGLSKVEVVQVLCNIEDINLQVEIYKEQIIQPLKKIGFIIDCRDSKQYYINSKVKISLDGFTLYVDSLTRQSTYYEYHKYTVPRNEKYIHKAMDVIFNYLVTDLYLNRDFRIYNLETNKSEILETQ